MYCCDLSAETNVYCFCEDGDKVKRMMMIVEYDGSNYHGFQRQDNANTIQAEIEKAIFRLIGEKLTITGASRTDAGVHAKGQVIAFDTIASIPASSWPQAMNSFLPPDIQALSCQEAAPDFHPQFQSERKRYAYYTYRQKKAAIFYRNYALCTTEALNVAEMQKACQLIEGQHNCKAFCASGSSVKSFERNILHCNLVEDGAWLRLDIEANGFLYNMVRIIMGTLLEVGRRRIAADYIKDLIESQNRCLAGPTAPPQGLYLQKVYYPPMQ